MSNLRLSRIVPIAGALALAITTTAGAQSATARRAAHTDARWYPFLGCWQSDSAASEASSSSSVACVAPVAGSSGVEMMSVVHGRVTARERLDATAGAHAIDGQGCKGTETSSWAASGRRVYLHADYTCSTGIHGSSATLLALTPDGAWLRVEEVRSGSGAVVSVDRRRPTGATSVLPAAAVRSIDDERLLITTARAAAAAPITLEEVVDATHAVGPGVAAAWLGATRQQFALDAQQTTALLHADLPPSVVQAMLGSTAPGAAASVNGTSYDDIVIRGGRVVREDRVDDSECDYVVCYAPNPYSMYNGVATYGYGSFGGYGRYGYTAFPYIGVPIIRYAPYNSGYRVGRDGRGLPGTVNTGRDGRDGRSGRDGRGGTSGRDHTGSSTPATYSGGNRQQPASSRPPVVGVRPRGAKPR